MKKSLSLILPLLAVTSPSFAGDYTKYKETCGELDSQSLATAKAQSCIQVAYFNQSRVVHHQESLDSIKTAPELKKKLLGTLIEAQTGKSLNLQDLTQISDRLFELSPEDSESAKLVTIARMMSLLADPSSRGDADRWKSAKSSLEKAEQLSSSDLTLAEMKIIVKSDGLSNLEVLSEEAQKFSQEHGETGIGEYYLAYVDWKNGNSEKAKERLAAAVQKQSEEERFSNTLEAVKNAKDTQARPFQFNLSVFLKEEV